MAVSGISTYNAAMYQWQNQQLKATGNTSSGASSSLVNSLFSGGSASMTQQVSSMVELTKYAMDAMGVTGDSRVTFSQITRYREQLQQEFDTAVKNGLTQSGISNLAALGFEMDKNGKIAVTGENASDRKKAQQWLDANPSFGESLYKKLPEDMFDDSSTLSFKISSTGVISVVNEAHEYLHAVLREKGDLAANARDRLQAYGVEINYPIDLHFDVEGDLVTDNNDENSKKINAWLKENPELADEIKKELEKGGVSSTAVKIRLGETGGFQLTINDARINEAQKAWQDATDIGGKIQLGLSSLGIDKNISFSIQIADDGSLKIISDHPDAAKVQKFFDENPELVKKYRQIETLAGIDDARAAMQLSPSAMRKRIQIESMAAWWAGSNDSTSYFGNYNNGLSLLSGINLTA